MKKTIRMISAVFALLILVNTSVYGNVLNNPGYEQGDPGALSNIIGWTSWGPSGEHHQLSGYTRETKGVKVWYSDAGIFQDFDVVVGVKYTLSLDAITPAGDALRGWDLKLTVEWLDETYAAVGSDEIGRFEGAKSDTDPGDGSDTWVTISGSKTAVAGAVYGRFVVYLTNDAMDPEGYPTAGAACFDDASVTSNDAQNPSPQIGAAIDAANPPAYLEWTLPEPNLPGNIVTCNVFFGENENMSGATQLVFGQTVEQVAMPTLTAEKTYYWRVDSIDAGNTTPSQVWYFSTVNQAPIVDAGPKGWCAIDGTTASYQLDSTVDDFGTISYLWQVQSQPLGAVVSFDDDELADPIATFDTVGEYILEVIATDEGLLSASDTVMVIVQPSGYTGLVAHWQLDGDATDSSGNGHNGTASGSVAWTTGQINDAVELDGLSHIDCGGGKSEGDPDTWADITDWITVSAWFKADGFNKAWQSIVTKGDSSWRIHSQNETGAINFTCSGIGDATGGSNLDDGRWHQAVGVYDGVTVQLYIDGLLVDSQGPDGEEVAIATCDYDVRIGSNDQFPGSREFDGLIDDVQIYEVALTATEIADSFFANGGSSCQTIMTGDLDGDCYVNLEDFALLTSDWLKCNNAVDSNCQD